MTVLKTGEEAGTGEEVVEAMGAVVMRSPNILRVRPVHQVLPAQLAIKEIQVQI